MRHALLFISALAIAVGLCGCADSADSNAPLGDFFGLPSPGETPEVFAPGIFSRGFHEHGLTISPDGSELFFGTSSRDHGHYTIVYQKAVNGRWQPPEIASFAGDHGDMVPRFSPDGNALFFSSRRSRDGRSGAQGNFDIWVVQRTGDSWGEPQNLGGPVNTTNNEFAPTVSSAGNLYFQCWAEDGSESDICLSRFVDGAYQPAERLGPEISADGYDGGPFIAPDESYLLFQSLRPGNLGEAPNTNIYVSFRAGDGTWGAPVNLGEDVNGTGDPISPMVSPDGRFLFFSTNSPREPVGLSHAFSYDDLLAGFRSHRNGYGTVYWLSADRLSALRETHR